MTLLSPVDDVAKVGDKLRVLDLTSPTAHAAILAAPEAKGLDEGAQASGY